MERLPVSSPEQHMTPKHTFDTELLKERLFAQDERLMGAANRLANVLRSLPHDPRYPDTEPRALIVGGFVRDAVLGGHPKDIDLEVYGVSPERLEDLLNQLYPGIVNTVGRSFGILKIHLGDDVEFDVSIPRRESKSGKGHKWFTVDSDPGMSIADAARRRDFRFNSMAADPLTGEVIDPYDGLADLHARTLRVTDPERFQDDPLRVYRALQFAARMDLMVEAQTLALLKEMVKRGDLDELPKERISDEIKKLLLKSERPAVGFELARELGIIQKHYPELHALIGCPQEREWHPEGDVWIHTMMVLDEAAKISRQPDRGFSTDERLQVLLGALCHDLGKPPTTRLEDGRIRSKGHEEAGEEPTKTLCEKWSFAERDVRAAIACATHHLKPGMLYRNLEKGELVEKGYTNAVRRLLKSISPVSWRVLLASSEADFRGRTIPGVSTSPYAPGDLFAETVRKNNLDMDPTKPLIQGRDLLELGLKPGPQIGQVIKAIEHLRDEGKVTTRDEALARLPDLV